MKTALVVAATHLAHKRGSGGLDEREAFCSGLMRHGWNARVSATPGSCDLLVIWGVRQHKLIERQRAVGGRVCILERGYVGDRFHWTSVSFGGGLNGRGLFRGPFGDASRWNENFGHLMQPWRASPAAGVALIMGQVVSDMSVRGVDIAGWYGTARAALACAGIEVAFRPHPHGRTDPAPLAQDLDRAAFVVTWNSNSAVDAVLAGVPAVAMDKGSMAWDVAGHELKRPPMPDRADWAHALAWRQWRKSELQSGACWEAVGGE